jgi:dolichol-phosphate mannosyltransferase
MFGRTTNSLFKNIWWAKKGILSFSYMPLSLLSFVASILLVSSVGLGLLQVVLRLLFPDMAPKGVTTMLLVILFFGSINLMGIATVGEYIAKILEETKRRPHFIRRAIIRGGEVRGVGPT